MASIYPQPKMQFFTNNGDPAVGYKLYTYEPGTAFSVLKTTYSDDAGTPNTNPIIMDARGEASVFWSGQYDVKLTTDLDVLVWTQTGVGPEGLIISDGGVSVSIITALGLRAVQFASMEALRLSNTNYDYVEVVSFHAGGTKGTILLKRDGTSTPTGPGAVTTSSALKNETFTNAAGNTYKIITNSIISDTSFGAVADGYATDCLTFRQNALDWAGVRNIECVLTAGCLQNGQLNINYSQRVMDLASRALPTKIPLSHTGTALRFQTNETPYYEGGWYMHFDGPISAPVFGVKRSRTGIGLDVFGNTAAGSSVQAQMTNVGFEGFSIGGQFAGCFNSAFRALTFKRNDINYNLRNDINNSVVFFACKANLDCSQHIIANGINVGSGITVSGSSFINCEFENADRFPFVHVQSGVTFQLDFSHCYTFENNFGSFAGSGFHAMRADIPGRLHMVSTPINSTGKSDSILFFGRRGGSVVPWDINIDGCRLTSVRTTAGDEFDIDFAAGDSIRVNPNCFYTNTLDAAHTISSYNQFTLFKAGTLFNVQASRVTLDGFASDVWLRASGDHLRMSNGDAANYLKGHYVFRNGVNDVHLWFDGAAFRWKIGQPATATDGTLV